MKKNLLAVALVMALALTNGAVAQANGGFGFSIGLRLSGDVSWTKWHGCQSAAPSVWPMGGPSFDAQPWGGYAYPAPMMGGFDPGYAPAYPAPSQYAPMPAAPAQLPTPMKETPPAANPTSLYQPASFSPGSAGYLFPSAVPSYWR